MVRKMCLVAAAMFLVMQAPALAVDQTSWTRYSDPSNCNNIYVQGYMNFCRVNGTRYVNVATARDSDLRSQSGGLYQDKFLDSYVVGNLNGVAPNTYFVYNWFSSTVVSSWTGTCYSGTPYTMNPGSGQFPSSSQNLRSFAKSTIFSC